MSARVVLVHGAWHDGSCWAPVVDLLAAQDHDVVAVDLPSDRPGATTDDYVDAVLAAVGDRGRVVLVGHSLGGLTVPVAAQRLGPDRVAALVLVAALVPLPGSSWADRTRAEAGIMAPGFGRGQVRADDGTTSWSPEAAAGNLYAGVVDELESDGTPDAQAAVAAAVAAVRPQDWTVTKEVTPLTAWPAVPTVQVVCAGDRVVDPQWSRTGAVVPGAEVVELAGGHFPMLTRPAELAELLAAVAGRAG
ncbi:alpha/beta hydrolase [Pseudonocardia sp. KRD-184]|uniref:Alpha/beta hydrolase n=1 Tax=Pseudonocardia oceani TaxID=2792013 RepID=A0ABS6U5S6_9PSEU|nr:alpha/beta fold hydrolase [Pseudonocardia oceani]MBW0093908.1 alpha/beta hydrolase [Pseudonocardia oceani]MBW0097394.1 alpha/beta hydrolase [Pseudonocardia oceani]MBW0111553.1 alpha/beta hydrolase [Pseudonocardia oceani]MBW0124160.1 alpha/beta hydrolase [Pseudonocardia oceani]MBW0127583.1 alpha/beta hydrolase [Pseudonocardia oceani]